MHAGLFTFYNTLYHAIRLNRTFRNMKLMHSLSLHRPIYGLPWGCWHYNFDRSISRVAFLPIAASASCKIYPSNTTAVPMIGRTSTTSFSKKNRVMPFSALFKYTWSLFGSFQSRCLHIPEFHRTENRASFGECQSAFRRSAYTSANVGHTLQNHHSIHLILCWRIYNRQ